MPRSVRKSLNNFDIRVDTAFEQVILACADRDDTWISKDIVDTYSELHRMGYAHSVEAFAGDRLVGGLYGVAIGGAFFGESMFFLQRDASKVAFYCLVDLLRKNGFLLLDSQYLNEHTQNLGAIEIPKYQYFILLNEAIALDCSFP